MMQVSNLSVARGGITVLEGVSFGLAPAQVLVLRGANGIGKTTLLRTLAGLQPPVSGEVTGPEAAYGAHADGLKSGLTVTENLTFWADVHGVGGVEAALQAMDLVTLRGRRAADLSAGQKRRLGLARLLVSGRSLWLLDEPTVSLDATSVALFGSVLRGHLAGGGMAVIATHIDLGLPEAIEMDLTPYRATSAPKGAFDSSFDGAFA